MLITLNLRVTTRWLGDKRTNQKIRKFDVTKSGNMKIDADLWLDTMYKAGRDLGIPVNRGAIMLPDDIPAPKFHKFKRVWNKVNAENFESIVPGTIISIPIVIDEDEDEWMTKEIFLDLMAHVGQFYGLSPWGSKFNLGRFTIE
jgi:hypothetical protein